METTPKPLVSFSVRLPKDLHAKLERKARADLSTLNREVNLAVRKHVEASNGR